MTPGDIKRQLKRTDLPVHRNVRRAKPAGIYIVWTYAHSPAYYEDDGLTWRDVRLQVDLWGAEPADGEMDDYAEQVEALMREIGFTDIDRDDEYEETTSLDRVRLTMEARVEVNR